MSFEKNTKQSFMRVKQDMIQLQQTVAKLNQNQQILIKWVQELKAQTTVNTATKTKAKRLVASKESDKVHESNCPFAKNIKEETKQNFDSIKEATSYGYNLCSCVEA